MTEAPISQENIPDPEDILQKLKISRVRIKTDQSAIKTMLIQGKLKPEEMEITAEGRLKGERPRNEGAYCRTSFFSIQETPKGQKRITFDIAAAGGSTILAAQISAITSSSEDDIKRQELAIKDALIEKINPELTKMGGFVLRRDEWPMSEESKSQRGSERYYVCEPPTTATPTESVE